MEILSYQTCTLNINVKNHSENLEQCINQFEILEKIQNENRSKFHLILCMDKKLMVWNIESWLSEKLPNIKTVSLDFSKIR